MEKNLLIVQVYVDDIIFRSRNSLMTQEFVELMRREFEMSMMGELSFFFGLQIKQTLTGTLIHQQKYVNELLKRFNMNEAKEIDTPIATASMLDMNEIGSFVEQNLYRGMIGSPLFLMTSRPDIVFSVGLCARL